MPPLTKTFDVVGIAEARRMLIAPALRARDLSVPLELISFQMMKVEFRMFRTRGAAGGTFWDALSKDTIATKRREGAQHPTRPLWWSGDLARSLSVRDAPGQILVIEPHRLIFGTKLDHAHWHETGTSQMPQRRPLVVSQRAQMRYIRMIKNFIFEGRLEL